MAFRSRGDGPLFIGNWQLVIGKVRNHLAFLLCQLPITNYQYLVFLVSVHLRQDEDCRQQANQREQGRKQRRVTFPNGVEERRKKKMLRNEGSFTNTYATPAAVPRYTGLATIEGIVITFSASQ